MYCHNCGSNVRSDARFCTSCGSGQGKAEMESHDTDAQPPAQPASQNDASQLYKSIGILELHAIIQTIPSAIDVRYDHDSVMFKFKDKDQDLMMVVVNEISEDRVVAMMPMKLPDNRHMGALIAANNWNQRKDAHDTFAYMTTVNNSPFIIIESHLFLSGGLGETVIRAWVKDLLDHINLFEEQVIATVKEIGEDKDLLKGGGGSIWRVVGEAAEGFLEAWLRS